MAQAGSRSPERLQQEPEQTESWSWSCCQNHCWNQSQSPGQCSQEQGQIESQSRSWNQIPEQCSQEPRRTGC